MEDVTLISLDPILQHGFEVRPLFASIWDISSPKARQSHVENNTGSLKTAKWMTFSPNCQYLAIGKSSWNARSGCIAIPSSLRPISRMRFDCNVCRGQVVVQGAGRRQRTSSVSKRHKRSRACQLDEELFYSTTWYGPTRWEKMETKMTRGWNPKIRVANSITYSKMQGRYHHY